MALLALLVSGAASYQLPAPRELSLRPHTRAALAVVCKAGGSAGRGFGKTEEPRRPQGANKGARDVRVGPGAPVAAKPTLSESLGGGVPLGASAARGKAALERLRADAQAGASTPPRRKMELTPEELEPLSPEAGVMPEVVSERMLRRVVPFAGLPVFGSLLLFVGFYVANTQLDLDLPPQVRVRVRVRVRRTLSPNPNPTPNPSPSPSPNPNQIVATATQALLLLSFAGITYGVMSTSWDEEEEGSALGFTEFVRNVKMARGDSEQRRAAAIAQPYPRPHP